MAKSCIDSGFSSVMLDGSHHAFEENVSLTKQVVEYAHEKGVTVEGELGVLAGVEDEVSEVPPLRFDILEEIERRVANFPIVLHGASAVVPQYVDMINAYGGKMDDAVGIPAEQLRKAASSEVCKINIDSDGRLAMTAMVRKIFVENPGKFDPRKYLGPAREELIKMVMHKNEKVLGSAHRA